MTSKYNQRMEEHKKGKTRSTKNRGEFISKIIEKCETRREARLREKYWKSGCGKEELKKKYYSGVEQSGSSGGS